MLTKLKQFIIDWNNNFLFDRLYRERFNIGFNTAEHRALNQIDIKLFFLESYMFSDYEKKYIIEREGLEKYQKDGIFIKELPQEKISELFDAIDIKNFKIGE